MLKLGFIGAGTVGTSLAVRLRAGGYPVVAVASRSLSSAQRLADAVEGCMVCDGGQGVAEAAQLVFITTPDDAIESVASSINWHRWNSVVHCSGADSVDILESARMAGARVGAFHPLQTFASVDYAIENLPGSTFALEAGEHLLSTLEELVEALGGYRVRLEAGDKVLYHAAAVIACNYTVTLVKLATDLWRIFGVSTPEATRALLPLLRGTVSNIAGVGLPHCLTGPIARGDLGTTKRHLAALRESAPSVLSIYRELGLGTIPIALDKGRIDEEMAEKLRELLERAN
jgi:predicted short-subunit dehydrogenase-like oxidoreductase (DUF2520 family)